MLHIHPHTGSTYGRKLHQMPAILKPFLSSSNNVILHQKVCFTLYLFSYEHLSLSLSDVYFFLSNCFLLFVSILMLSHKTTLSLLTNNFACYSPFSYFFKGVFHPASSNLVSFPKAQTNMADCVTSLLSSEQTNSKIFPFHPSSLRSTGLCQRVANLSKAKSGILSKVQKNGNSQSIAIQYLEETDNAAIKV